MRPLLLVVFLAGCGGRPVEPAKPVAEASPKPPKILFFYPNAPTVARGEDLSVCYGVENATHVAISPLDDNLKPSISRCVTTPLLKQTTFTIKVTGPGGEATQSFTANVGPAEPKGSRDLIRSFNFLGAPVVAPGTRVQFCYSTDGASQVTVQPPASQPLAPGKNQCFAQEVKKSTTYLLTATAADGAVDRMQVTVKVQ